MIFTDSAALKKTIEGDLPRVLKRQTTAKGFT
jgi:hypothetical protein